MTRFAPGPTGHPLFGCFRAFRDNPLDLLSYCRTRYGEVVRLPVGLGNAFCLVFAPGDLEQVFHAECMGRSDIAAAFAPLAGGSMIIADGDAWRHQRRAVIPSFAMPRLQALACQVDDIARRQVHQWGDARDITIDLQQETVSYAMAVLTRFLFGRPLSPRAIARIAHWWPLSLRYMNVHLSRPLPLPDWFPSANTRRLHHAAEQIAAVLQEIITAHRADPPQDGGFLGDLLAWRDGNDAALTDTVILREIMGVFLAGFDTVASAMMWTLADLARHPAWQQAVHGELDTLGDTPSRADNRNTPLLHQAFSESVRLAPPLWLVDRKNHAPIILGGQNIPAKTNLIASPWVTHRDPALWETPAAYRPERFDPTAQTRRPKYAYFPFGGGRMKCIGIALAHLQLSAFARAMLTRFTLMPGPQPPTLEPAFVLRTRDGLPVRLLRRQTRSHAA